MELLERDQHLALLHERFALAEQGEGQIVFLGGEAGTGKTSLVWRFSGEVCDRAPAVVGECDGLSTPQPFGPLIDIVEALHGRTAELIWAGAPRLQIFHSALDDLTAASAPLVVIIEDAHWADESTRDLIRFLARRWRLLRMLLIITFRCDEAGPGHPLRAVLGELGAMSHVRRIKFHPLSPEAVAQLTAGTNIDSEDLYRRTCGNPFFVTEVLASGEPGIPPSIRDAVMARAARLPGPARGAIEAAAVLGASFEKDLLMQVADGDPTAVDDCLKVGMLAETGATIRFQHELARQAIRDAIGPARRAALHRRTLEVLGSGAVSVPPDRLVFHAEEAGDWAAVIRYGKLAAQRAAALGAHRDAAAQYERVLRFADHLPDVERLELLERYADEADLIGNWPAAIEARRGAIALCRSIGDRSRLGENEHRLAHTFWHTGSGSDAITTLSRAIVTLEDANSDAYRVSALGFQTELALLSGQPDETDALGATALAAADAIGDIETRLQIMTILGANALLRDHDSGQAQIEESMRLAFDHGSDRGIKRGWGFLCCLLVHGFRFDRAEGKLAMGIAYAQEHDFDRVTQYLQSLRALMHLHQGHWPAVEQTIVPLISESADSAVEQAVSLAVYGRLLARRGDPDASAPLDRAMDLATRSGNIFHAMPGTIGSAEAAWLTGDRQRAATEARRALPRVLTAANPCWVGELSLILHLCGESDLPVQSCAAPFRLQIEGDWAASAAAWTDLGCPYQAAVALSDGDATAQLQALEIFDQLGARPMIERTVQRLRNLGVRTDAHVRTAPVGNGGVFGITPREHEVLALLADGLSDRAIAESLYIEPGTVRSHLTNLFSKLGVKSRTAAIAAARRGGLL
jgi:DNA-binding CsgD family transcriptional regulator